MWRQFEFECPLGGRHGDLVNVPDGDEPPAIGASVVVEDPRCGCDEPHTVLPPLTARYLYDRPFFPEVMGGKFDTQGYRKLPPLPLLPDDAPFDKARDLFESRDYKERRQERHAQMLENEAKKTRAAAAKVDPNINLRTHPLPGDPPKEGLPGKRRRKVRRAS